MENVSYIVKNGRKFYKSICSKCGKDRGYKRSYWVNGICRKCSQKDDPIYEDYIVDKRGGYKYRFNCPKCNKDKGYLYLKDKDKNCLSCSRRLMHSSKTKEEKLKIRVKISCTQQDIVLEDFNGFSQDKDPDKKIRKAFSNSDLRERCFKLYNYKCDICNKHGILNAHHIYNWNDYSDLRFDIDNLVCLCEECHKKFHINYSHRNNNLDDYISFKSNFINYPFE